MPLPKIKRHANGNLYATWSLGSRSYRESLRTTDLRQAKLNLASNFRAGNYDEPQEVSRADVVTVRRCWETYKEHHISKLAAPKSAGFKWDRLEPYFADLTVVQVDQRACDDYVAKRTSGRLGGAAVKPQSCRAELAFLFAALRFCAAKPHALFPASDIETVKLPEPGAPRDRWLTIAEMNLLLKAAERLRLQDPRKAERVRLSRGERFLRIALEAPARMSAILDLTWDRVDFTTNTINFEVPGERRTKKRRVTVAMSKGLRPVMELAFRQKTGPLVMDHKAKLWPTLQLIAIEAGLGNGAERPKNLSDKPSATGISPHVLRHSAATHMARNGVPLWKIAKILGNTLAMVEKVYAKWTPEDAEGTVDLITGGGLVGADEIRRGLEAVVEAPKNGASLCAERAKCAGDLGNSEQLSADIITSDA